MADSMEEWLEFPEPKHENARAQAEMGARILLYKDHKVANKQVKLYLCKMCEEDG